MGKKNSLPKYFYLVVFVFLSLLAVSTSLFTRIVKAADSFPAQRLPCTDQMPTEFASDRPYQDSPCGDRPVTYWCGNSVVISLGTVHTPYCDKSGGQLTECPCTGANCDHTGGQKQTIDVDLTDVQLPILGNTELTVNSQSTTDQIDDGTKTSNYVAWYLGGTNDKAEYLVDPTTSEGVSKIIDTSGPLKKLLPSIIQDASRINSIDAATKNVKYTPDGAEDNASPPPTSEPQNHNQIVVCANHDGSGLWAGIQDFLGLGKYNPTPCYTGGSGTQGNLVMRLKDWDAALPANISINLLIQGAIQGIKTIYPFIPTGVLEDSIGKHWASARPPLPWDDGTGIPFKTDAEYQKAYYEWKGNICGIIPVINKVVCLNNIFVPTKYSDLYQYVPLANTTDKKGSHMITHTHVDAPKATLEDVSYAIIHSPQLYLAHSLEDFQLTNSLISTFKPAGLPDPNATSAASVLTSHKDVEDNSLACKIIPSRTNPGDAATFTNPKSHIQVDVEYRVTQIECTNIHWVDANCERADRLHCSGVGHWDANCSSTIYATVDSVSKTAYQDEIWNNTVAGDSSIFRRIYPKTGPGSPVSCIADTPASSNATYTLDGVSSPGLELVRVVEPDNSSVKSEDGKVANAQLYYPHLGGVLDYFLNGIQTALLPQGYGPPPPGNGTMCGNTIKTTCDGVLFAKLNPPGSTTAKASDYFKTQILPNLTPDLMKVYAQAEQRTGVPCEVIAGVHFEEADNNPGGSLDNGGPLDGTLLDSAIKVADEIRGKVGGKINNWDQLITALSRYNGGGNSQCGKGLAYTGPCPPPEGIDDLYPTGWLDSAHIAMYLRYCQDGVLCNPIKQIERPGVLAVATELYNSEKK